MSELDDFLAEIAAVEEAVASGAISTDDRDDTHADAPQQYAPPTSHAETSHMTAPPASASNDLPHLSAAEVEGDVADAPDAGGSGAEIRAQNSNATSSINGAPSRTAISAATAAAQSVKPSSTATTSKPASFAPRQAVKSVVAFKPAVLSKPAVISKAAQPSSTSTSTTASAAGPAGAASSSSSSSAASGPYPSSAASSMQQQQYQQQQQQQMMIDAAAYAASVGGVGFGMGRHGAAAGSGGSGYAGGSSAAGAGWPNAGAGAGSAAGYGGEPHAGEKRKFIRVEAGEQWEDPTLGEWPENDYRLFCGDLGHDVTDDILAAPFRKFRSFVKAKCIRQKFKTEKTKGYGFVSFLDPWDAMNAMKEMNGQYIGTRPVKIRRSNWNEKNKEEMLKKEKDRERRKALGLL